MTLDEGNEFRVSSPSSLNKKPILPPIKQTPDKFKNEPFF